MTTATRMITAISSRVRPPPATRDARPPERLTPPSPLPGCFLLKVGIVFPSVLSKPLSRTGLCVSGYHRMIGLAAALMIDARLDLHDAGDEVGLRLDFHRARPGDVDVVDRRHAAG